MLLSGTAFPRLHSYHHHHHLHRFPRAASFVPLHFPLFLALLFFLAPTFVRPMLLHPNSSSSITNFALLPGLEPMSGSDKFVGPKYYAIVERVIAGQVYEWSSNIIPFQIWGGDTKFQNLIRRGIKMWEESTCLRFRENVQATDAIRYVLERGDSCFTEYIGRNGGFQDIIIGSECAEEYVVAHETGHALGYWHTHINGPTGRSTLASTGAFRLVRSLRKGTGNSVGACTTTAYQLTHSAEGMCWKKRPLPSCPSGQCFKRSASNRWVVLVSDGTDCVTCTSCSCFAHFLHHSKVSTRRAPYDYGSLMHYHAVAHARQVSDFTIVPKELKYVTTMGTERMAFLDAKVINDIYCPNACSGLGELGRPLRCQSGGYPDPNNCNVCRCPEGLGGTECERLQPSIGLWCRTAGLRPMANIAKSERQRHSVLLENYVRRRKPSPFPPKRRRISMLLRLSVLCRDKAQIGRSADRLSELLLPAQGGHRVGWEPNFCDFSPQRTDRALLIALHPSGALRRRRHRPSTVCACQFHTRPKPLFCVL
ncbi:hypothetical protein niasHT_018326 [Heterodera trifolii]|uniref:Metalloendopeptidase n=1 Tax=Heterodera trifolii TaxID=157864 RepID=A0ABD2L2U5_9BILA